jgi:hypothetical protein
VTVGRLLLPRPTPLSDPLSISTHAAGDCKVAPLSRRCPGGFLGVFPGQILESLSLDWLQVELANCTVMSTARWVRFARFSAQRTGADSACD